MKTLVTSSLLLCLVTGKCQLAKIDTVRTLILYTDTLYKGTAMPTKSTFVLSVRELHNNTEGKIDPYWEYGFEYKEFYIHKYFLTINKKPIPKNWIIWQSK